MYVNEFVNNDHIINALKSNIEMTNNSSCSIIYDNRAFYVTRSPLSIGEKLWECFIPRTLSPAALIQRLLTP